MIQGPRRPAVVSMGVSDIEVEAGGVHWPVEFTRRFDGDGELEQVDVEVASDSGYYARLENYPAAIASEIRRAIAEWCERHPPLPDEEG